MPQTAPTPQSPSAAPTATQMFEAARLAANELRGQVDQLQHQREELRQELRVAQNNVDRQGIESRLAATDARIADVEKQIASAEALVAQRAAVPGVVVPPPQRNDDIPPEAIVISGMAFAMIILLPMSIAMARRIWRRAGNEAPKVPTELPERVANMERGIEAVAIEVERLGEGQRFMTQLLAEGEKRRQMQALPAERPRHDS